MESILKKSNKKTKLNNTKLNLIISITLTVLLLIICIIAPYIAPYDPNAQDLSISLSAPSSEHIFGTDKFGRDVFSRVLCGGAPSVFGSVIIVFIVTVIGVTIGVVAGYFGGKVDSFISKITDIFLAFPGMVLAVAIAGMLGIGIVNAIIALAAVRWTKFARLARSKTISIKENTFIYAWKISGLSFLGLGVAPPTAEWGYMLNEGKSYLQTCPWMVLYPGFAIIITVMILNYLGDSIRDFLDPNYKEI